MSSETDEPVRVTLEKFKENPERFAELVRRSDVPVILVTRSGEYEFIDGATVTDDLTGWVVSWADFWKLHEFYLNQIRESGLPGLIMSGGNLEFLVRPLEVTPT